MEGARRGHGRQAFVGVLAAAALLASGASPGRAEPGEPPPERVDPFGAELGLGREPFLPGPDPFDDLFAQDLDGPATHGGQAEREPASWEIRRRHPWLVSFVLLGAATALQFGLEAPEDPRWEETILFDEDARGSLRGRSSHDRDLADGFSTGLQVLLVAAPFLQAGAHWWAVGPDDPAQGPGRNQVFFSLFHASVDAHALTWLGTAASKVLVARRRPVSRFCERNPELPGCDSRSSENESFWSGHTAAAFSGAGLVCAQRQRVEFGAPTGTAPRWGWDDTAACGSALVLAAGTGLLRVVADEHHTTDVLVGAAVGAALGYGLPQWWLSGLAPPPGAAAHRLSPWVGRGVLGARYAVRF